MSSKIIAAIAEFNAAREDYVAAGEWIAGLTWPDQTRRIHPDVHCEATTTRSMDATDRLVSLLRKAGLGGFKHEGKFYIDGSTDVGPASFEGDDYHETRILVIEAGAIGRARKPGVSGLN